MSDTAATQGTRRTTLVILGITIVTGCTYVVMASYNYMVTPMLADLGLTAEQASLALKIPSLASLLVVFLAGRMGDRLGHRRIIILLSIPFIIGCFIVSIAQDLPAVMIGMFIEGVAGTAIEIIALGLLVSYFVSPEQRNKAFAVQGVAYPAVFLVFPVLAGWLITYVSWRVIPFVWVAGGIVILLAAMFAFPPAQRREPLGEPWTPLLAGVVAVCMVQLIGHSADYGVRSLPTLVSAVGVVVSSVVLVIVYRRTTEPSLSIAPLRNGATSLLLIVVILVPLLNTLYYLMIAFQYMYQATALEAAIYLVPSQVAGILGALFVSDRLSDRIGLRKAGTLLLLLLAAVMSMSLFFSGTTPLWVMVVYGTLLGFVIMTSDVIVLNAVMSSGPDDEGGNTAAFETSAEQVGAAFGIVLMGSLVFGVGQMSLENGLEQAGLPPDEAASVMSDIQQNSASPELMSQYSYPLPDGGDVTDLEKQAIADGLRVNGAAGIVISLVAAGLFAIHRRGIDEEEDSVTSDAEG